VQTYRPREQNRERRNKLIHTQATELIFNKVPGTHLGKDSLFSKWFWKTRSTCKRLKLDPCLTPYMYISSKWIKDLNTGLETVKLLEVNTGEKLHDVGLGTDFLDTTTPKAQATKTRSR